MSESKGKKKIYGIAAAATAAVAVIVLAVVLILGTGGQESYRSIRIVELDGGVTIEREGIGNLEASVNMNLTSGDRISTSADSYVVLRLDDDKYMMLGEQGAIQVVAEGDAVGSRTEIHLESGSVLSEIQNPLSQGSSYEIVTPNATMSVRGTVFETRKNVESDNMEVLVYEGTVAVALGGSEPALYGSGEYTAFTSGDTPRFIEERGVITEERMNSQMLERLQQINENGRTLDFGEADLEELVQRENSGQGSQVADNSLLQDTAVPDNTLAPDNTPAPETESPAESTLPASPSASARPVVTAPPTASPEPAEKVQDSTPTPAATPTHTVAPRPTETPTHTVAPRPTETPTHTAAPRPTETPTHTAAPRPTETPTHTAAPKPTETPTHTPTPDQRPGIDDEDVKTAWHEPEISGKNGVETENGTMWKAIFYMPAVSSLYEKDGKLIAQTTDQVPGVYNLQILEKDHLISEPAEPKFNDASGAQDNLTFVGWYTEENEKWDFQTDKIDAENVYLFPVWKDTDGMFYYPIILRDADTQYYRCFSVKVGSYLYESPEISESGYNGYQNNNGQNREGYMLMAWEIENRPAERNALWGIQTEKISGVTSLRAVWGQKQTPELSLILFTTDTKENGYGDLVDFYFVQAEQISEQETLLPPDRPFSSELILPEEINEIRDNPDAIDWRTESGESYSTITTVEAGKTYIFHAVLKQNESEADT